MPARKPLTSPARPYRRFGSLAAIPVLAALCGCATSASVRATAYDIRVRLDPATHQLHGETVVTLRREPRQGFGFELVTVEFALNRALKVKTLMSRGAKVREHTLREPPTSAPSNDPDRSALIAIHRVVLYSVGQEPTLTFKFSGELFQDVQAGEKHGQIHNLMMAAHISPEGIFLDENGGWYPSVHHDPAHAQGELATYHLTADPVSGMKLVAGADPDEQAAQRSGKLVWSGKYPMPGLALVGGAHQVKEEEAGAIHLALHYSVPTDEQSRGTIEANTGLFLAAAKEYLQRYPPLIGPYPFDSYTIVENFFSSGFAFPEFTLLNQVLLQMGPRALMHGYLDHEMLHSWWGNTIYVDPADGDWCEAITSYAANYYGYVLDGDEQGARNQRRNCCVAVSRLKPEDDKPLGTFGGPDGAGRDIGYGKGAMVFYMLARQIGQDNFWAALRRLTNEYTGRYANWRTLQGLFEQQSGTKLDAFFRQWVRAPQTPRVELQAATWRERDHTLDVTLAQSPTAFALAVPLRVVYEDGTRLDRSVEFDTPTATVRVHLDRRPSSVVLDADYQVLRRLSPAEIIPSSGTTRAARQLLVTTSGEPVSKFFQRVIEDFSGEPGMKEVTQRTASDVTAADLAQQSVLILGDAVRSAPVQALLARTDCPIRWPDSGFEIGGVVYAGPEQSVLCTVHHPDLPEGGITLYYGNSEAALGRSDLLLFYRDSLVIFETTGREVDGSLKYDSRVVGRQDFESPQSIAVAW
jgi:aminopeptidase N